MKHFIQFDENGEIQFVVRAEFDAVIADENKSRFIEVTEAQAEEIKKNPKGPQFLAGKIIKRPAKPLQPTENTLLPTIGE